MSPRTPRSADYAAQVLHRQRLLVRKCGLFGLAAALVIGAMIAPNTTLLVFVLLVMFGAFGVSLSWVMRRFDRWMSPRK